MMQWTFPRIVLPDVSTQVTAVNCAFQRLADWAETTSNALLKAFRDAFRPDVGRGHEDEARAEWRAFESHQRHLRGLLEQELLLRSRRLGPAPGVQAPRWRPRMPRRREHRRRPARDG